MLYFISVMNNDKCKSCNRIDIKWKPFFILLLLIWLNNNLKHILYKFNSIYLLRKYFKCKTCIKILNISKLIMLTYLNFLINIIFLDLIFN